MNILFSLTYYTPYVSGLTLYVKRLAEAMFRKNYQVTVLTMQFDKILHVHEIVYGVRVVRAKPFFRISKGFVSFDWLIKSIREVKSFDVIIISLPQFEGIIPAFLGRLFGKKIISIYHCEVVLTPGFINKIIEKLLNISNMLTLLLSHKIVTYTEDFAKDSKILPRFLYKTNAVYPPIIEPKIDKRKQKLLKDKIGSDPITYNIGVAARLAAEKGIEYLLESIPAIRSKIKDQRSKIHIKYKKIESDKDTSEVAPLSGDSCEVEEAIIKIVIAGPLEPVGERAYKEKIMKLVEKYKDCVVFLGELKEEEMGSFYSLLDVLILPSINSTEAFGMVQVEAMMMGVPVVSTDLPGVRVPIQKTGMGISVPIKNSQKLAEAIVTVLLNKKKFIKNRRIIEREFSFKKTIDFYHKLFGRLKN